MTNIDFFTQKSSFIPLIFGVDSISTGSRVVSAHYENTPMQYTAIFHGGTNDNFQMNNCDNFRIFAQNINRGS